MIQNVVWVNSLFFRNVKIKMKSKIIFTTLLIEKSPQSIPLGAACVASAVKNNSLTKDLCDVELLTFNIEDFENTWNQKQKKNNFQNKNHSISTSEDVSFEIFCASLITKKILEKKPEIVGFSVFVWNSKILQMVSQNLKNHNVFTLAGGPEITAHPQVFKVFDKIYHDDIMKQVEVGKKLLIRYLREQNIKVDKNEIMVALNNRLNCMSILTSTIPNYVIATVIDILGRGNLGINALNSIVKGFNKFYTDIMTQQE